MENQLKETLERLVIATANEYGDFMGFDEVDEENINKAVQEILDFTKGW